MELRINLLHKEAKIPVFAYDDDAGMDLCAVGRHEVLPGQRILIPTGIAVAIPKGYVGLIWDKSGVAIKGGIKTLGGVVDAGYRGEVMVGVVNLSSELYVFESGHKVAQMIIQERIQPVIREVESLDETPRGEG